jgi:hypothetical protein
MMINKESWNNIEETLKKLNTEYANFDKLNKIFYLITKNIDRLVTSFIKQHRMDERILICDVSNILNIARYQIPNHQLKNEITQVRLRILKYSDITNANNTHKDLNHEKEDLS